MTRTAQVVVAHAGAGVPSWRSPTLRPATRHPEDRTGDAGRVSFGPTHNKGWSAGSRYDAYGKQTVTSPTGAVRVKSSVGNRTAFTGRENDIETGLMCFRARYYSTSLGRFIGRDPVGYVDGYNLVFAYFTPLFTDPTGLTPCTRVSGTKIFHDQIAHFPYLSKVGNNILEHVLTAGAPALVSQKNVNYGPETNWIKNPDFSDHYSSSEVQDVVSKALLNGLWWADQLPDGDECPRCEKCVQLGTGVTILGTRIVRDTLALQYHSTGFVWDVYVEYEYYKEQKCIRDPDYRPSGILDYVLDFFGL